MQPGYNYSVCETCYREHTWKLGTRVICRCLRVQEPQTVEQIARLMAEQKRSIQQLKDSE